MLARELEAEPEAETRHLYQEILRERLGRPSRADRDRTAADPLTTPRRDLAPLASGLTEVPLVGRAAELDLLRAALDTAWAGHPRLFLVRGEAGIGKSRLIAEGTTGAVRRGGRVLVGQCHESEQALPFGPWVDLLRTALAELGPQLAGLAPAWRVELARLLPELSDAAASPPEGPAHHRRLFEAVATFAHTLARSRPLVLVLEDLHWADEPSLRLAVSLCRRLGDAPVLVVASVREEDLADTPERAHVLDLVTEAAATVTLGPLSRPDIARLVAALGRRGADVMTTSQLADRVWAVSEGHPLMAVEATRAYGAEPEAPGAGPEAPAARLALPERIHDLVVRRLRRVSDAGRAVLAGAAVAGRPVDFAVLQQAAGLAEADAAAAVEELVRRRLLREVGEGLVLTHDRVREVVYGGLLAPRRRLLHRRVAEALEAQVSGRTEPHALALGRHFEAAEAWDKAARYLRQAGLDAFARGASREAAQSLERALGAAERLPAGRPRQEQLIDLRLDLRLALAPLGEVERVLRYLEEARSLATTLGDARRSARASVLMSYCFHWMGQPARGLESARQALAIASDLDDRVLAIEASYHLGQTAIPLGRFRDALEAQQKVLALLEGAGGDVRLSLPYRPAVACRIYIGLCLGFLGEFADAGVSRQEGLRLAESVDHVNTRAFALQGAGWLALIQGEALEAIPPLERALEICTRFDIVPTWPVAATLLGWAYALTGRPPEGIALVEEAEQRSARLRLELVHGGALAALSEAYLLGDRRADAQAASQRALEAARAHQQRWQEAEALRVRGDIVAAGAAGLEADSWYGEALALASTLGMAPLVARCRFARAMLLRREGHEEDAQAEMEAARQSFRRMGMKTWLERTEATLIGGALIVTGPVPIDRRSWLRLAGAAAAACSVGATASPTPKRGGVFRLRGEDPTTGFDPHRTVSFRTLTTLSLTHSRLVKVKAGTGVAPGTVPLEPDLAESWTRPDDRTYLFRLRRGARWHPKPPVNGREVTAEDVKYTYDRFRAITGNPARSLLDPVEKIEALDRYTVRFVLTEPFAWFLDVLASTSMWIVPKEAVDHWGDLRRAEACVGTGPWMLERYEPGVRLTFARNPHYFLADLPYADAVEVTVDADPASRLAAWLAGQYDFAPEYDMVVRRVDLDLVQRRKPGLQTAEFVWLVGALGALRLDREPFKDLRVRQALALAGNWREGLDANAFAQGHGVPNPAVPAAFREWSIPIDQLPAAGRRVYEQSLPEARRLLVEAGYPNGLKIPVETTAGYGPDYMDLVQVLLKNWKAAGVEADLRLKEYGAFLASAVFGKFDALALSLLGAWTEPDSYLYRLHMPGQPTNASGVDDPRLSEMIRLQRRAFDPARRRQILYDIQRYLSERVYYLYDASISVVAAWEPYVRNFAPNFGHDYGGRLMVAWLDR